MTGRANTMFDPLSLAVFASRDRFEAVVECISHLERACRGRACLDVLVNGNQNLALQLGNWLRTSEPIRGALRVRVWTMGPGDKAQAFNAYLHDVWPGAPLTYFVDGYVCVRPDALSSLATALDRRPGSCCACGVPTVGLSARRVRRRMQVEGGLHGNLFALTGSAMQGLRDRGFRLPAGLYRVDSTIGAAIAFGLDPSRHPWDPKKHIVNDPGAHWTRVAEATTLTGSVRRYLSRRQRQAQGDFENRAVSHFFARRRQPIGSLAPTVNKLVDAWAAEDPAACNELLGRGRRWRDAWDQLHAVTFPVRELGAGFELVCER